MNHEAITSWEALKADIELRGGKFLSHSHFAIGRKFALELCRGNCQRMPRGGWEVSARWGGWLAWVRNAETKKEIEAGPFVVWGFRQKTK